MTNGTMSYDTIATISQVTSLLMFMCLFAAVVAYAFWPGNKARFDKAQARALELDRNDNDSPAGRE